MLRRDALIGMALGSAGLMLRPRLVVGAPEGLEDLASRFRKAARSDVLDVAARAVVAGAGHQEILGAVFLAGIQDVRPRHVGGKLHCVMMVESAFKICERLPEREALLLALWNLDDFKRSQAIDRREGEWVLPGRPDVSFTSEASARKEFLDAMESWDEKRADRAIVGLIPFHDLGSIYEILWPYCARSFVDIGHKIIYGAQLERVIRRIGWRHAEPTLRSLVYGLLHSDSSDRGTAVFDRSVDLAPSVPDGWLEGKEDPAQSGRIMRALRTADSAQAQRLVIDAFRSGLGPGSVWDGLRLAASEVFLRRPPSPPERRQALLPVHAVTVTNAFGHAWRSAGTESLKRILLLQSAGWLPDLREALVVRGCHVKDGPGLDTLGPAEGGKVPGPDALLDERSPALARAALDAHPEAMGKYRDLLRRHLASKGVEHHQHKYAAAFMEEGDLVHPSWRSRILAPAIDYLPNASVAETDVAGRSDMALRKAGVAT